MSRLCLYLTLALMLCLFAANSSAKPKPNPTDIDIIINRLNKHQPAVIPIVKGTYFLTLWPGICVKYFLSFPQKNLSPEKTETN